MSGHIFADGHTLMCDAGCEGMVDAGLAFVSCTCPCHTSEATS